MDLVSRQNKPIRIHPAYQVAHCPNATHPTLALQSHMAAEGLFFVVMFYATIRTERRAYVKITTELFESRLGGRDESRNISSNKIRP